jgi:hypothetical protein
MNDTELKIARLKAAIMLQLTDMSDRKKSEYRYGESVISLVSQELADLKLVGIEERAMIVIQCYIEMTQTNRLMLLKIDPDRLIEVDREQMEVDGSLIYDAKQQMPTYQILWYGGFTPIQVRWFYSEDAISDFGDRIHCQPISYLGFTSQKPNA